MNVSAHLQAGAAVGAEHCWRATCRWTGRQSCLGTLVHCSLATGTHAFCTTGSHTSLGTELAEKHQISTYSRAERFCYLISTFLPTLLSWSAVASCWNLLAHLSRHGGALFLGHRSALFPWHRGTLLARHAPAAGGSNRFAHLSRHLHTLLLFFLKLEVYFKKAVH